LGTWDQAAELNHNTVVIVTTCILQEQRDSISIYIFEKENRKKKNMNPAAPVSWETEGAEITAQKPTKSLF
jgi:hypothetical protein